MKCFSERWNADWHSSERLEELLIEFFEDDEKPKSITHLYAWLNQDWMELERRKTINDDYRKLLEVAELMCEEWVVDHGFGNDKSFARWYLERYHTKEETITKDTNLKISFV